jgi:hypothetical protein
VGSYPPSSTSSSPATIPSPLPPETTDTPLSTQGAVSGTGTITVPVPVLLVNRRIARHDLARDINTAIGTEIVRALTSRGRVDLACPDRDRDCHDLDHDQEDQDDAHDNDNDNDNGYDIPEWVADRVNEFVLNVGMYPFVKENPPPPPHWEQGMGDGLNKRLIGVAIAGRGAALRCAVSPKTARTRKGRKSMHIVGLLQSGRTSRCADVVGRVQEFYGALERGGVISRVVEAVVFSVLRLVGGVSGSYFLGRWADWSCYQIILPADVGRCFA